MSWKIKLEHAAEKQLRQLSSEVRRRVLERMTGLRIDPFSLPISRLKGRRSEGWRLRVGKHRVLFELDQENKVLTVFDIDLRDRVYKER